MSHPTSGVTSSRTTRHFLGASTLGLALTCVTGAPVAAQTTDPTTQLPSISVEGQGDPSGYKVDRAQSPKLTAPLVDTPKTITVIPQEVIQERGQLSLQDVLRTTPGITLGSGEGGNPIGDRPFIRGFDSMTDTFVDGLRDTGSQTREVFNLEQVEISKGPGSAYSGRGSTGGSLNLVTKTPKAQDFVAGTATLGTDHTKRLTGDVNYKVNDGVALRLNAMVHDADVAGRDVVEQKRWGVAPSLAIGLNGPTRAFISFYHFQTDDIPDYGIPYDSRTGQPAKVDRHNFYGLKDRDFQKTQIESGTLRLEHDINSAFTLRNSTRVTWSENKYVVTNPDDSRGNVVRGRVWRSPKSRNSDTDTIVNQTDLSGEFQAFGLKNSVSTGAEFSREHVRNRAYTVSSGSSTCNTVGAATGYNCTSLFDPTPDDPWAGTIVPAATYTDTVTKTAAAYAFDTIELTPQWQVNLGLRFDDFSTRQRPSGLDSDAQFWSYQTGIVYKPLPNGSVYVSHSTSANPVGESAGEGTQSVAATNYNLDPEKNRSYELGTKWDFLNRRLGVSAAVFRTEKTNARVTSPTGGIQLQVGEQRVQGLEVGLTGSLTDAWNVFAGYTYLDSKVTDPGPAASAQTTRGKEFPNTPPHSFNVWTTYKVFEPMTVGGGVYYMARRYGDGANTKMVPSYWRFDAMASYAVNQAITVQLNVQNIFNETYYDKPYTTHFATLGAGRTALLSTSFKF